MANMENNHSASSPESRSPLFSFVIIIAFALVGLFLGNLFGLIAILPYYDFDLIRTERFLTNPMLDESGRFALLVVQGMTSIFSFILAPLLYIYYYERNNRSTYLITASPLWPAILLSVLIIIRAN